MPAEQPNAQTKSAIIIGAGPGGLAAALLLANAGVRVKLFEKQAFVGGRCSTHTHGGYSFDLGPTFFLYPTVLERIFRAIGRDLHAEVPMVRLDPQYKLIFGGGGELLCTPDLKQMAAEVAKLSPVDGTNVERFIAENRVKLETFRPALERPFHGWRDLFNLSMLKMLPLLRPWNSLDKELNRYFTDPRIRLAFTFQSKYLGMSPFNCPSLFSILSYLEYDYGVWHPIGGCGAVSERMAAIAEEMGVDISLGESVEEILVEDGKAVGVRTASGVERADAVVVNADFAHAMTTLLPDKFRRRWQDRKLEKKKYSCSTFMMYLGIEGRYENLEHHTIVTAKDYIGNLDDIENRHRLSDDPSLYIQNASVTDDTLAPEGHSTLYVLAPVSHRHGNIDWARDQEPFRAKLMAKLADLGLKDLVGRIRYEKIVTPQCWEDDYSVYRGATFNLAHNLGQMLHLRPRNRFEDVKNMYLVGGGTHPGSGLPVIYESARITSRLLLEDLNIDHGFIDRAETTSSYKLPATSC